MGLVVGEAAETRAPPPLDQPAAEDLGAWATLPLLPGGTPAWEMRARLGYFRAYWHTLRASIKDSRAFFSGMRADEASGLTTYSFFLWFAGLLCNALYTWSTLGSAAGQEALAKLEMAGLPSRALVESFVRGWALAAPLLAVAAVHVLAGLYHLGLIAVRANHRGYPATFRAASYGSWPVLLFVVPGALGLLAGIMALIIVQGLALMRTQQTDGLRVGLVLFISWLLVLQLVVFATATILRAQGVELPGGVL